MGLGLGMTPGPDSDHQAQHSGGAEVPLEVLGHRPRGKHWSGQTHRVVVTEPATVSESSEAALT